MASKQAAVICRGLKYNDVPPITKRKLGPRPTKNGKDRPMTQDERNAVRFEAVHCDFNWSNEDWAATWLPWVRLAIMALHTDDKDLTEMSGDIIKNGSMPDFLEGLTRTKRHLAALVEGVNAALNRTFLAVERHGYSPENPPPDGPIHLQ
jgi:hypothetical protein